MKEKKRNENEWTLGEALSCILKNAIFGNKVAVELNKCWRNRFERKHSNDLKIMVEEICNKNNIQVEGLFEFDKKQCF
jgi:hypothetical protein